MRAARRWPCAHAAKHLLMASSWTVTCASCAYHVRLGWQLEPWLGAAARAARPPRVRDRLMWCLRAFRDAMRASASHEVLACMR